MGKKETAITAGSALVTIASFAGGPTIGAPTVLWIILGCFGGAGVLYGLFMIAVDSAPRLSPSSEYAARLAGKYSARLAKRNELDSIQDLAEKYLPNKEVPSRNDTKKIFKKHPKGFYVIEKKKVRGTEERRKIVGFFTLGPINQLGARELHKGKPFREDFLARSFNSDQAVGVYIGSVVGRRGMAEGVATSYLLGRLETLCDYGLRKIYTRPITMQGLELAKREHFEPVRDDVGPHELNQIYFRDMRHKTN